MNNPQAEPSWAMLSLAERLGKDLGRFGRGKRELKGGRRRKKEEKEKKD